MKRFWSDPYLWLHVAGAATLPLWLLICLLGLAAGDPILPLGLEVLLVGIVGIAPVVWMQMRQPYSFYSLLAVTLKPEALTEDQRRVLTLVKGRNPLFLAAGAGILLLLLKLVADATVVAVSQTPLSNHFVGLLVAALGFLGANLFMQVPLSAVMVLLKSDSEFAGAVPYGIDRLTQDFTVLGIKLDKILPQIE
jgi:hypothetical protein